MLGEGGEKGKWLKLIDSRSKKYRRKRNMEKLYKDRENNFIEAFCSLWPASRDLKKAEPSIENVQSDM